MDKTNDAEGQGKTVDAKRAKAETLGLEEKAKLILAERGKESTFYDYFSTAPPEGEYTSLLKKTRYVDKKIGQHLEIITVTEELKGSGGTKSTNIFMKKPSIIPFLYLTRAVYASEAPLHKPEEYKVTVLRKENDWIDHFNLIYSYAKLDEAIHKNQQALDKLKLKAGEENKRV